MDISFFCFRRLRERGLPEAEDVCYYPAKNEKRYVLCLFASNFLVNGYNLAMIFFYL
ncbi:hypothetical protein DYBT9275_03303 [Dyadobacter sp. CECT 9275]|uniref:Uncharacterized protein n=1 Tax=Dyadobacter helix TaxID=2822344 RepID=A0A916JDT4_9BACT|nr:hypothetical protein DYBT9275_03303 [Dyadobacter sp. CECT 9275]